MTRLGDLPGGGGGWALGTRTAGVGVEESIAWDVQVQQDQAS